MARHLAQRVLTSQLLKAPLQLQKPLHFEKYLFLGIFTCQRRLIHKDVEILDHTCEITSYNDYRLNYKPIVQVVIQTLKEILNTSTYEANKILMIHPQLKKRSRANILNNYYNLLEAGIQKSTITRNIWLLAHEDVKLKEKLNCISALNMSNEELIPWLRFTQDELVNNINHVQTDPVPYTYNKIEYLAHRLECSIEELCKITVRCPFILKTPVSYIDKKLNVLYEYNINNKNILKDLWVLRYSENHIRHRCELYKDTGNMEIKTWAIRCPLKVVTKSIQKNYTRCNFLQSYNDISEYLLDKLNVKEEDLELLISKSPSILRINPIKLDKIITILYDNGITSDEIIRRGSIFYFNVETIQNRVNILKKKKFPVTIAALKLSEKSFERYINKCEESREKKLILRPYRNNKEFLMHKLKVDEETIAPFVERWPLSVRVDAFKVEELINLLNQYGIKNDEILTHGRIFNFKVETLRKRLETLKEAGLEPKITIIMFSNKYFDSYMRSHEIET